jgi:hypothetical protein
MQHYMLSRISPETMPVTKSVKYPQTAHVVKMISFCDIAPCSLVEADRCFRRGYCLYQPR